MSRIPTTFASTRSGGDTHLFIRARGHVPLLIRASASAAFRPEVTKPLNIRSLSYWEFPLFSEHVNIQITKHVHEEAHLSIDLNYSYDMLRLEYNLIVKDLRKNICMNKHLCINPED